MHYLDSDDAITPTAAAYRSEGPIPGRLLIRPSTFMSMSKVLDVMSRVRADIREGTEESGKDTEKEWWDARHVPPLPELTVRLTTSRVSAPAKVVARSNVLPPSTAHR